MSRQKLSSGETIDQEDVELMMGIETLYLEKLQQVKQLGISQGISQGEVQLTLKQLKRRFGELSPDLENAITNLPIALIETLALDLLDFRT